MPDVNEILGRYGIDPSMKPDPEVAAKFGKAPGSMAPPAPAPTRGAAPPPAIASILGRYGINVEEPAAPAKVDDHDPKSKGESFVRSALQSLSFGFGDEIAAAAEAPFSDKTYAQIRDEKRSQYKQAEADNPLTSLAGSIAGGIVTPGLGAAKLAAGGVKALATRAAVQGGASALGSSEADLTKGDIGGAIQDTATGAAIGGVVGGVAGKLIRGAPERVDKRVIENVIRGEAGGTAKTGLGKKIASMAGDDSAAEYFDRYPGLHKILATTAASSPKKAAMAVEAAAGKIKGKLDPVYTAIQKAEGGFEASDIESSVRLLTAEAKDAGEMGAVSAIEKWRKSFVDQYGADGAIPVGKKISADAVRTIRNRIGDVAFAGDPTISATTRQEASKVIHGAINTAIEAAGERAGVDVSSLATNNRDMAFTLLMKDALSDRAAKAAGGGSTLFMNLLGAHGIHGIGGALLAGGPSAAVGVAGGLAAAKASLPLARAADWQLARLVLAARNGSTAAQLGEMATVMGLSRAAGEEVASRIGGAKPAEEP